jgi:hypothetical protein
MSDEQQLEIESLQRKLDDLEAELANLAHADAAYRAADEEFLANYRSRSLRMVRAEALGSMQAAITIALITAKHAFGWAK